MKIGIINTLKEDSPFAKTCELICQTVADLETKIYQVEEFDPSLIQKDNLHYLLMYGASESDDGYAKAIKKHATIPLLYLLNFIPGAGADDYQQRYGELQSRGIDTYMIVKTNPALKDAEDLMDKLKSLREGTPK